jgi:S-adenosylmethionine:tRNA ribosyltransferase-isomerase
MIAQMQLADFDFDLPPELIAQFPIEQRSASRLLQVREDALDDRVFHELPTLLRAATSWS